MHCRLSIPHLFSFGAAAIVFGLQTLLFLLFSWILWHSHHPIDPIDWFSDPAHASSVPSMDFYPYFAMEIVLFILASVGAFFIAECGQLLGQIKNIRLRFKKYLYFVFLYLLVFLIVGFLSGILNGGIPYCGALVSLWHMTGLDKPSCGISSMNFISPWFYIAAILTICLTAPFFTKKNTSWIDFAITIRKES